MGMDCESVSKIFSIKDGAFFGQEANSLFRFQYEHNALYRQWCNLLGVDAQNELPMHQVPFLPISFFKTHRIVSTGFNEQAIFESSGTTQTINSKHFVKDIELYRESFIKAFELFYGDIKEWCIIGLLPSYLERKGSSLIMMVDEMIKLSGHERSGFYLNEHEKLASTLLELEEEGQKTLLIGVTFGLLDFAEQYKLQLNHTIIMETGGMKGRRKEMTRNEVHDVLKESFGVENIHSEFGMTELLSQAYSKGNGRFVCPPWMKVLVRDEEDPLLVREHGKGILNIIDLANAYSCSFIATDDVGIVHADGSFEVQGRLDSSDIRGCSLLVM
jgi:hypothetical protein